MPSYQRVLGFDFGDKSIGVAYGQSITQTAKPLAALKAKDGQPDWNIVEKLIKEWQPQAFIVGNPLNMDGTEQLLTLRAKKFGNKLHGRFGLPLEMMDERLTTVEAKAQLFEQGGYRALQKDHIDSLSAVLIIESWFSENN